jgi:hypothetical protein
MRNAHLRDAAALCEFFAWLEARMAGPDPPPTEADAAAYAEQCRARQSVCRRSRVPLLLTHPRAEKGVAPWQGFVGLSFETISAVGPNSAVIHYRPPTQGSRPLSRCAGAIHTHTLHTDRGPRAVCVLTRHRAGTRCFCVTRARSTWTAPPM